MGSDLPVLNDTIIVITTTSAGATGGGTFISTQLGQTDGYYDGCIAEIVNSTTSTIIGEQRRIGNYVAVSGTTLVTEPFTQTVPINTQIRIRAGVLDASTIGPPVSIFGYATANGTGTTLIDTTNLTQANDYWRGMMITMLSGGDKGLSRIITGSTQSTGTVTFDPTLPSSTAQGDFYVITAGAYVVPVVPTYATTAVSGTFTFLSGTSIQTALLITPTSGQIWRLESLFLDLNALTQSSTIQPLVKIDGTNYRVISTTNYTVVSGGDTAVFIPEGLVIDNTAPVEINMTAVVSEGASRSIPYRYYYTRLT